MMTLEQLKAKLASTGMPVAYGYFASMQKLPYILYRVAYSNNFLADSKVYAPINHIQIELYTKQKSTDEEDKVENALSLFCWEKTETYINEQRCYQIIYEIEV